MIGVGYVGQSNMYGVCNHLQVATPATGPQLARLKYFQCSLEGGSDAVGQLTAMSFDPALQDIATGPYDYPPTAGSPATFPLPYGFGPDVYCGVTVSQSLAQDIVQVKLAPLGTSLTVRPVLAANTYPLAWFVDGAHRSWDTTIARSSAPWSAVSVASGTATSVSPTTLTDSGASWATNQWAGCWVVRGGYQGLVASNSGTVLQIYYWMPYWTGTPAAGAYTIEQRSLTEASLSKSFTDGYCAAAKVLDPSLDMRVVCFAIGETDAQEAATAAVAKASMLSLIWWIRNRIVALGCTSVAAGRIGIVLGLVKEIAFWPYAAQVNAAYREIAEADPYVRLAPVADIPLGGYDGTDGIHYSAAGQYTWGNLMGALALELIALSSGRARASLNYRGQHVVARPLWGVGASGLARFSTLPGMAGLPFASRRAPSLALLRDSEAGAAYVYLTGDGLTLANQPVDGGQLAGYGRASSGRGLEPVPGGLARSPDPRSISATGRTLGPPMGYCWPLTEAPFTGPVVTSTLGGQTVTFGQMSGSVSIPASSIDRAFVQRGWCGNMGISAELCITERVGAVPSTWMVHKIGMGDYRRAQTSGGGVVHVPPVLSATWNGTDLVTEIVPLDASADEGSPVDSGLIVDQMSHGGVAADGDAALWQNAVMRQRITPHWKGIAGCHRVVHSVVAPFTFGGGNDTVSWRCRIFLTDNFGAQWGYDAASKVSSDGGYVQADNKYWEVVGGRSDLFFSNGSLDGSLIPGWLPSQAGFVSWAAEAGNQSINDGLCVAIYAHLGRKATKLVCGNELNPAAPNDANYGATDQLKALHLQQLWEPAAGTAMSTVESAMFVLVGTRAQVKAAADQLYALGVDASWTQ